jgi:protease-4
MKKVDPFSPVSEEQPKGRTRPLWMTIGILFLVFFVVIPLLTTLFFDEKSLGNVAVIPIHGVITGNGESSYMYGSTVSSLKVVDYIKEADKNKNVKVILLEINSPGGSPVASDEIGVAVKKAQKPVIALIRETGASGGYWIASAADYVIAHRMSLTGSIGVVASHLEFSGLMEKYGVGYERLVAGDVKDMGTPFKKMNEEEKEIMQKKLVVLHDYFIDEVAQNRKLAREKVVKIATGEVYLGVEAMQLGLVDELGDYTTAEDYMKKKYALEEIEYVKYEPEKGLLDVLLGVMNGFSFNVGKGFGASVMSQEQNKVMFQ